MNRAIELLAIVGCVAGIALLGWRLINWPDRESDQSLSEAKQAVFDAYDLSMESREAVHEACLTFPPSEACQDARSDRYRASILLEQAVAALRIAERRLQAEVNP